jgi:uncharacterized protein YqgV (UPF0045/DUF77 family)
LQTVDAANVDGLHRLKNQLKIQQRQDTTKKMRKYSKNVKFTQN